MMSEKFRLLYRSILVIVLGLILYGLSNALKLHGVEKIFETSFGEISVAVGTILLAFFTMELAYGEVKDSREMRKLMLDEAITDRIHQTEENAKERRKERLREQLQFYSPIVGKIRHKDFRVEFMAPYIEKMLDPINGLYEIFAEPRTKRLLREYFEGDVNTFDDYSIYSRNLRVAVLEEFGLLRDEYLSLMVSYAE